MLNLPTLQHVLQITELTRQLTLAHTELARERALTQAQANGGVPHAHQPGASSLDLAAGKRYSREGSKHATTHGHGAEVLPPACLPASPTAAQSQAVEEAAEAARAAEEFTRQLAAAAGAGYLQPPTPAGAKARAAQLAAQQQQPATSTAPVEANELLPAVSMFPRPPRGPVPSSRDAGRPAAAAERNGSPSRPGSGVVGGGGVGGGGAGSRGTSGTGLGPHSGAGGVRGGALSLDEDEDELAGTLVVGQRGSRGTPLAPLAPAAAAAGAHAHSDVGGIAWGAEAAAGGGAGGAAAGGDLNSTHRYGRALPSDFKLAQQLRPGPRQGFV